MAANEVGVVESQALSFSQEIGSGDLVSVIKEVADSVVEIKTQSLVMSQWPMNQGYVAEGAGSGVIITEQGHIVTNWHVAEDAQELTVRLNDGSEYPAQLLAYDEKTDLALLKIEADNLVSASLADSDEVQVGQQVFAIGNPLGQLGGTVTEGIISATSREITVDNQTMTLLQTSAAVNSGNSGGGLFDSKGNLVGIINAKSSGIG
ncbi:MAG: trypsin-like serine protease, partial [Synergistaceae bacterium]|nr:trypsin-like serine protease [Synergistaceae bacterium]